MPKGKELQGSVFANSDTNIPYDLFTEKFIEFVEVNGWQFGDGSEQVDDHGNDCEDVPVGGSSEDNSETTVSLNSPRLIRVTPTRSFQLSLEYPESEFRLYDALTHLSEKSSPVGDVVEDLCLFMTAHVIDGADTVGWANDVDFVQTANIYLAIRPAVLISRL